MPNADRNLLSEASLASVERRVALTTLTFGRVFARNIIRRRIMSKKVLVCMAALLVAISPAAIYASGSGRGGGVEGIKPNKVEGTVTAVNVNTGDVTITTVGGVAVTVKTNAATKIERNDVRVPLARILVGDRGQAIFDANKLASKVESTGP